MKGLMVEVCKATGRDVKKLYYDEERTMEIISVKEVDFQVYFIQPISFKCKLLYFVLIY
jgi:hypothetical protein